MLFVPDGLRADDARPSAVVSDGAPGVHPATGLVPDESASPKAAAEAAAETGIAVLWDEMLALLVIGIVVITASSLRFQKRLG